MADEKKPDEKKPDEKTDVKSEIEKALGAAKGPKRVNELLAGAASLVSAEAGAAAHALAFGLNADAKKCSVKAHKAVTALKPADLAALVAEFASSMRDQGNEPSEWHHAAGEWLTGKFGADPAKAPATGNEPPYAHLAAQRQG